MTAQRPADRGGQGRADRRPVRGALQGAYGDLGPEADPAQAEADLAQAEAERQAAKEASDAGAWGPRGPSPSYAEWLAEGQMGPGPGRASAAGLGPSTRPSFTAWRPRC